MYSLRHGTQHVRDISSMLMSTPATLSMCSSFCCYLLIAKIILVYVTIQLQIFLGTHSTNYLVSIASFADGRQGNSFTFTMQHHSMPFAVKSLQAFTDGG